MAELFFGDFRFDTRTLRLEGSSGVAEVRAKTLELLTYLIEHRNRFVPRDELMRHLWPEVTVTDASLTQCVSELRQVLNDSPKDPLYIETRIKKGYRFAAVVYHRPTERLEPLPPPPDVADRSPLSMRRIEIWAPAVILVATIAVLAGWWIAGRVGSHPVAFEVIALAASDDGAGTGRLVSAVHQRIEARLSALDGVSLVQTEPEGTSDAAFDLEVACAAATVGHELTVTLRSTRHGETRWGWTWIVPDGVEARARLPEEIAERVLRSVTSELGLSGGPAQSSDPRRQEG
jgi:DNA-binding winged helix-turn-helix (wHTH) protein